MPTTAATGLLLCRFREASAKKSVLFLDVMMEGGEGERERERRRRERERVREREGRGSGLGGVQPTGSGGSRSDQDAAVLWAHTRSQRVLLARYGEIVTSLVREGACCNLDREREKDDPIFTPGSYTRPQPPENGSGRISQVPRSLLPPPTRKRCADSRQLAERSGRAILRPRGSGLGRLFLSRKHKVSYLDRRWSGSWCVDVSLMCWTGVTNQSLRTCSCTTEQSHSIRRVHAKASESDSQSERE